MDQRACKRLPVELAASYKYENVNEEFSAATILNLTPGGICFTPTTEILVGEKVELKVQIKAQQEARVVVQIVWTEALDSSRYRCGGKIVDANKEDEDRFIQYYCEKALILNDNQQAFAKEG